ncbi:HalOD1 output domain-containing protein [Natrarchaeobius oligotrophus]|uniref:Halobacterial output domain-containing protein n=1 Tax=Natrarchaeobius chitinivorans TaxID=1679083 RepID=A0A3N6M5B9_NATCH|nr:HalOD1 output domain-containing protein [Natrarchaeobius chitinivorans]RQG98773.1 hypothetical protein EA472_16265 [Natrarchaeobius chitinivorans]
MNRRRYERSSEECTVRLEVADHERPSTVVVRAIERASDEDATEIRPLYESVAPESLDRLFAETNSTIRRGVVAFSVDDYEIRVVDGEYVELTERPPDATS